MPSHFVVNNMNEEIRSSIILPRHIGIIMDGNGRWAKRQGLERTEGHKAGAEVFRKICDYASELGVEALTFYAFSTENWKRPEQEVSTIMNLFRSFLEEARQRREENEEKGLNIRFIGDRNGLPEDIVRLFESCERDSAGKSKTVVNLAVNYGGRAEITNAVKKLAQRAAQGEINPQDITIQDISDELYTAGLPEPDLIIRPGGENRISNFLIWQSAYAEYWFTEVLWPDFTPEDLDEAIIAFCRRNRRFGGI